MTINRAELAVAYPLLSGAHADLPEEADSCFVCQGSKGHDARETITLVAGAAGLEPDGETYGPSAGMKGFFSLRWSCDLADIGQGYLESTVPVAEEVAGGQFSIRLCSTQCLRDLFESWADELERSVSEERLAYKRWREAQAPGE